ncbi:hypothetical protein RYZ26_17975 [Terasakiella sp. A23]|uniref:hypothetical protein n=1 Tax=Terasakiella sp. FCG-A23 TaxID=3080561 RepID=UPI0029545F1F|nr:hypothetical protein [Terasakiella sp. A23]MDV7341503.1 hypothetical protein [Terasakiella sp. A23]
MIISDKNEIYEHAFGCWITAFWGALKVYNPSLTLKVQKETFFTLLKEFLDEGQIVLLVPYSLYQKTPERDMYDCKGIWDVPHTEMISYMRTHWPDGITDENDLKLNDYFYSEYCPMIGWVDEEHQTIIVS